jgi:RNA polymerase sigma-70 factor, ECF subfamily
VIGVSQKVKPANEEPAVPASVRAGDQLGWFEQAFQQHWERIVSILSMLVDDPDEAQDLALEVFWRLYTRPPRQGSNLGGWLQRVALNLGYNALRAARRRKAYEKEGGRELFNLNSANSPAVLAEQAAERFSVRSALAKMKPRQAQLLVLRHSGLSYAEVAAALNLKPSSIGALLARAEKEFEQVYRSTTEGRQ